MYLICACIRNSMKYCNNKYVRQKMANRERWHFWNARGVDLSWNFSHFRESKWLYISKKNSFAFSHCISTLFFFCCCCVNLYCIVDLLLLIFYRTKVSIIINVMHVSNRNASIYIYREKLLGWFFDNNLLSGEKRAHELKQENQFGKFIIVNKNYSLTDTYTHFNLMEHKIFN